VLIPNALSNKASRQGLGIEYIQVRWATYPSGTHTYQTVSIRSLQYGNLQIDLCQPDGNGQGAALLKRQTKGTGNTNASSRLACRRIVLLPGSELHCCILDSFVQPPISDSR